MKVLMTGGAGYIGSHTCVELLNTGYEVVIIDNFVNSKHDVLDKIRQITEKDFGFYEGDLTDRTIVETIFSENQIDAVMHFAGLKAVGESVKIPLEYYHNNLMSTLVLCETMKKYNVKKIVFSSSATVYGNPHTVPIKENFPTSTTNPYGSSKLMIENILQDLYIADNEWSIALLRYFNPIGAHKSSLIGEDPNGIPNNLLPYVAKVAIGQLGQVDVFGSDYPTVDGTGVRDYIHVVDLALGHIKALEKVTDTKGIDTYNLATGNGYSVLQVIEAFRKASGRKIAYQLVERRAGDIATCYADTTKARQLLGWKAIRGIDEMCEDAWRFACKQWNDEIKEVSVL